MSQKDIIGIKFGVAGGGSILGESGKIIKGQLETIVSQIKLKVNIDQVHFRNQVAILKKELDEKIGNLQVGIKSNVRTAAPSKATTPKMSEEQLKINAQLKEEIRIRKELAKIGEGKRESYRGQLEKELSAHENIRKELQEHKAG